MNYSDSRLNGMECNIKTQSITKNEILHVTLTIMQIVPMKYSRRHYSTNNLRACSGSIKMLPISLSLVHPKNIAACYIQCTLIFIPFRFFLFEFNPYMHMPYFLVFRPMKIVCLQKQDARLPKKYYSDLI